MGIQLENRNIDKSHFRFQWRAWLLAAGLVVAGMLPAVDGIVGQSTPGKTTSSAALPEVAVVVHMGTTDLTVTDIKYRVFYNKFENKTIPIPDFDFAANLKDELMTRFAQNTRAKWRLVNAEEEPQFEPYYAPKAKPELIRLPESVPGNRFLLVDTAYFATIHSTGHRLFLQVIVRLVDRTSGRVVWKKGFLERMKMPTKLEELQADNQKGLKEALNQLQEKTCVKVGDYVVKQKI